MRPRRPRQRTPAAPRNSIFPSTSAPVAVKQADAFQPLRALLAAQQPDALLEVYSTRAPKDGVFVSLQTAMVVSAPRGLG